MKKTLRAVCLLLASACSSAQATDLDVVRLARPNIEAALAAEAAKPAPKPYRFGVGIPVRLTSATAGLWQTLSSGEQVWRLQVEASEAKSLSFAFTRFQLPTGAKLSVSAPDGRERHGPYLAGHATAGQLWTPPVSGAAALIELRLPAGSGMGLGLELTQVNYGFRSLNAEDESQAQLLACNVDVACPQGDEWRNESRAVARLLVGGVFACSGTLMNNTARDFKPYVLTANHCFKASGFEASSVVVLWNYQRGKCRGAGLPPGSGGIGGDNSGNTQTGATMRSNDIYPTPGFSEAANSQADFALIELSQKPPAAFRVYYSGWDRRPLAPTGVTGIHHPEGQPKNISLTTRPTTIGDIDAYDRPLGSFKYFLQLNGWEQGSTASGSSGSGLWNKEHRLVGNLTGGVPQDSCPHTGSVIYFRFFSAWNYVSKLPGRNLPQFLDPRRSGVQVLDGADPNSPRPR